AKGLFPADQQASSTLLETHISYVILKGRYTYKIKKPLKLTFLNFKSLSNRKKYCNEEIRLNKRLSGDLYKDVLPVGKEKGQWIVGSKKVKAVEYAVRMKRMNPDKMMNECLKKDTVRKVH